MANRFRTVTEIMSAELAKPYVLGESDCFFLGCRVADALDPALGLVERYWRVYSTLAGAERALRKQDCKTIADLYGRHLAPCAPAAAQFGDIAVLQLAKGQHVAVCLGRRFRTRTERGPADYGIGDCIAAFRTGAA